MSNDTESHYLFEEVQRFTQLWVWVIMAVVVAGPLIGAYNLLQNPPENSGLTLFLGILFILVGLGLPLFILSCKLTTQVRYDGLYVRFAPFHRDFIKIGCNELKDYEVKPYNALTEYGGWGIRFGRRGKAYNVSGNRGVQLTLENGENLLIGSQKSADLLMALQTICKD